MSKRLKSISDLKNLNLAPTENKAVPTTTRSTKAALKAGRPIQITAPAKTPESLPQPAPAGEEEHLFQNAMQGVDRIPETAGRQVAARSISVESPVLTKRKEETLTWFLHGSISFELEFNEDYMHGFVRGLDLKTFHLLKNGRLSSEAHLDLHGLNTEQGYDSLLFFLRESYLQGRRCVLLVTGRGKNSPGGQSVLKQETLTWLTRDPLRQAVLAFCTAQPQDGGAGALYVLLRKYKKVQGKVRWGSLTQLEPKD